MTWDQASDQCHALGARLPEIKTAAENQQILEVMVILDQLQWVLRNGITENGINRIIVSLLGTFSQSHQLENRLVHWKKEFSKWDQSLIGIRYCLAQSDPIKQRRLY
jgi:hypothetical protein